VVGRRAAVGAARLSSTADAYLFGLLTEESVLPAEFRELRLSKMAVGFARGAWRGDVTTRGRGGLFVCASPQQLRFSIF